MTRSTLQHRNARRNSGSTPFRSPAVLKAAGMVMGAMLSTGVFPGSAQASPVATATWTGATDDNWNTTSADWNVSTGGNIYANGDIALFPDAFGHYTVDIGGPGNSMVSPGSVVVDNDSLTGTAAFAANGGNYVFNGAGSIGGTSGGLTKTGGGSLTIENTTANTYTGATTLLDGSLIDQLNATVPTNLIDSSSTLALSGSTFNLAGVNNTVGSQSVSGATINQGASVISVTNGTGSSATTLNLGAMARAVGGTVDFQPGTGTITTTYPSTNGILGGWATVNGADWAATSGTTVTSYNAYTVNTFGANNNVEIMGSTSQSGAVNSLKFFEATADTLTLSGATTIGTGGILVSSALNGVAENINGAGTLAGSSGGDLIVLENDPNGSLTISNQIIDSTSATGLTKSGPGTLVLSNNDNTYSGVTTINGGVLSVASLAPGGSPSGIGESNNGASNLQFYGGTLQYTGTGTTTDRDFTVGPQGGTIDASGSGALSFTSPSAVAFANTATPSAVTFTLTGSSTAANSFSPLLSDPGTGQNVLNLIKNGGGTWVLPNANTYSGGTTINAGVLSVQNPTPTGSATGSGAVTVNANGTLGGIGYVGGPVTVNTGGSLAPGDGPGTLTINNSVVMNTGVNLGNTAAGLGFALNTPSVSGGSGGNDFATLSGNLTINPDLTLQATPGSSFGAGTYVLMHYGTGLTDSSNGFTGWNALLSSVPANLPSGSAYTMDFLSDTAHNNVDLVVSTTTPGTPPVLGPPASSGGGANGHSSTVIIQQANTVINNSAPGNPAVQINVPVKNGNIGGNNNNNNNGANFVNFNFFVVRGAQPAAKAFAVGWAPVVVQIAPTTPYYNVGGVPPDTAGFENASAPGWAYAGTIPTNPLGGAPGLPDTGIPVNSVPNNSLPNAGGMAILPYPGVNPAGNPVPPAGDDWLPAFTIAPVLFIVDPPATPVPTYYGESFDTGLAPLPITPSSIHLALVENNGAEDGLATSDDSMANGADAKADYQGSFLSLVDSTPGYSGVTSLSQLGPSDWLNFDGSYGTDMTNDIAWAVEDDPDVDLDVVATGVVPEPTSFVVLGAGACGMLLRRRRRIA